MNDPTPDWSLPATQRVRQDNGKYCSDCGMLISINAEICPNCGVRQMAPPSGAPFQGASDTPVAHTHSNQHSGGRNRTAAAIFAFFLGGIGAHHFYLGNIGLGILYLVFCWTFIPSLIAVIEGIIYLLMSEENFDQKYNRKKLA